MLKMNKKHDGLFFFLFLFSCFAIVSSNLLNIKRCKSLPNGCYALYRKHSFGGNFIKICRSVQNLFLNYNIRPNEIKSIGVGPNIRLLVFDHSAPGYDG